MVSEIINQRYYEALEVGILPDEFWEMSLGEVEDIIKARVDEKVQKQKDLSVLTYSLGALILAGAGGEYPDISEVFPSLFGKAEQALNEPCKEIKSQSEPKQEDWQEMKRRFEMSVQKRNKGG